MASPNPKSQAVSNSTKPIDILPSQAAQLYTHLHSVFFLSIPYFGLGELIRDPVATLSTWAPAVALAQAVYCMLCLPLTNSQLSSNAAGSGSGSGSGSKRKTNRNRSAAQQQSGASVLAEAWNRVIPAIFSLLLTFTLATPALVIAVVLFGAPVTTNHAETGLLALHLALLSAPALFYAHGLDARAWTRLGSLSHAIDEIYGLAMGACVGAWLGAIPIPLDWDRDWQRWPVTVLVGAYAGAAVGKVLGGMVFKGWKIHIS